MRQFIPLTARDGFVFPAYVAQPEGRSLGGVVVVQEIFGVNAHIRSVADGYAEKGWLAVAPAIFHRAQAGVELNYDEQGMKQGYALKLKIDALPAPGVMNDLQAAMDYAARGGKVGMVGYCWGGLLAWRAADLLTGLAAAVSYYGNLTPPEEIARHPNAPFMAHFGKRDTYIPLSGVEALKRAHPDMPVHLYDADHGFNCDARNAYDAPSARLARERTLAFFGRHLGNP